MPAADTTISDKHPNNIHKIIEKRFPEHLLIKGFKPTQKLLDFLDMTSYRFWKIYRCEESVTTFEAKKIAKWLQAPVHEVFPELKIQDHDTEKH